MTKLTARPLQPTEYNAWNEIARLAPGGNVFQQADWLEMLCATDEDLRPLLLGCFTETGQLVGGQALIYHRRWRMNVTPMFEFFYNSPLTPPLTGKKSSKPEEVAAALIAALPDWLKLVAFETHPHGDDIRPYLYAGWQATPLYTHLWQMTEADDIWRRMNREKRRQIRRAQEQYQFGAATTTAALDEFLPLYRRTMQKFSWRPSPKWEAIFRQRFAWMQARDGCRLHTVHDQTGRLLAGVVTLISPADQTAYLWRQGSVDPAVVPALYWFAAQEVQPVCPIVNFGGSPLPSLNWFKEALATTAAPHFRLQWDGSNGRYALFQKALHLKHRAYNRLKNHAL